MTPGRRRTCLAVTIVASLAALAGNAHGDPTPPSSSDGSGSAQVPAAPPAVPLIPGSGLWHVGHRWHLSTDGGTSMDMPPAYILDEETWAKVDAEMRRLQTQETRLTAENSSFRTSAAAWRPSWWIIGSAVASGLVAGWYIHSKI